MLIWIEHHLLVLGLLGLCSGLALGALLSLAQRKAGSVIDSRRRSAESSAVSGSTPTGTDSAKPRYQARSW